MHCIYIIYIYNKRISTHNSEKNKKRNQKKSLEDKRRHTHDWTKEQIRNDQITYLQQRFSTTTTIKIEAISRFCIATLFHKMECGGGTGDKLKLNTLWMEIENDNTKESIR